jgi:hemoglobin
MWHLHLLAAGLCLAGATTSAAAAAATPSGEEEPAPKSLFERAGGTYAIAAVADDFVDGLYADSVVTGRAPVRKALTAARKPGLKFQTAALLCQETGGPCKYDGRSMREAHRELAISAREWDAAVAIFKRALERAKVPAAERQELLNLLGTSKGDIVITPAK